MLQDSGVEHKDAVSEIMNRSLISNTQEPTPSSLTVLLNKPHLGAYIDPNFKLFAVVTEMTSKSEMSILDWPTYLPLEIDYNSHLVEEKIVQNI